MRLYDGITRDWIGEDEVRDRTIAAETMLLSGRKLLVFCFTRNTVAHLIAYRAALAAGHAVALADAKLSIDRKRALLAAYRPDLVISDGDTGDDYRRAGAIASDLTLFERGGDSGAPIHPDLAVMLATSGSTGSPKFVRLSKGNLRANAESIGQALSISPADCAITSLPFHHAYGLSVVHSHWVADASLAVTDESLLTPGFWRTLTAARCNSFAGVPYAYQMIERLGEETLPLDGIRVMTQAGGKLPEPLAAKFDSYMRAKGGRFYVMYGQTEATARMTVLDPAEMPGRLGSVGRAIPGGEVSVEEGEIVYRGPNVMMGYAACREDLRRGDEMGGVLRTGDQGMADEDGFLFVTGRRQRDAKVYGQRLNLDEIEGIMTPKGPSAAISLLERILVFCEWGDDVSLRAYHRELARTLNMHQSALELRRVPKIPVGSNGKTDYGLLQQMA